MGNKQSKTKSAKMNQTSTIVSQLSELGYSTDQINIAIQCVINPTDINTIIDLLETNNITEDKRSISNTNNVEICDEPICDRQASIDEKSTSINNCYCNSSNVSSCPHLKKLLTVMQHYNGIVSDIICTDDI
eukprot:9092_1